MWTDEYDPCGLYAHPYYGCVISATLSQIRSTWTQERVGDSRPQPRMTKQLEKLGMDDGMVMDNIFNAIQQATWAPRLSTFAWKLVAGVLPMGNALGRRS